MKFFAVLVSLFAAVQAQFSIGAPVPGAKIQAGQDVTVQIIVPVDTSAEAGEVEVSLVIGIISCPSSPCPAASADLGNLLFVGKYQAQGEIGNTLKTFENFTFVVPGGLPVGSAAIQAQHISLATPPGHAIPGVEYQSVAVEVSS